jgi:hypothetical protein
VAQSGEAQPDNNPSRARKEAVSGGPRSEVEGTLPQRLWLFGRPVDGLQGALGRVFLRVEIGLSRVERVSRRLSWAFTG